MTITLREITATNWRQVGKLRVAPEQEQWVAPNFYSLAQAAYGFDGELAHLILAPLAIYAGDEPVGFTLYNMTPERDRFFIMRLMIDAQHQGRGYGTAAMKILIDLFKANPQAKEVGISFVPDNEAARHVYLACGFEEVGIDGDEMLMWRALNEQPEPWTSIWKPAPHEPRTES